MFNTFSLLFPYIGTRLIPPAAALSNAASLPQAIGSGGGISILWAERCCRSTVRDFSQSRKTFLTFGSSSHDRVDTHASRERAEAYGQASVAAAASGELRSCFSFSARPTSSRTTARRISPHPLLAPHHRDPTPLGLPHGRLLQYVSDRECRPRL